MPGSLTPGAIALDWVGEKLYVVDILGQKVDIFDLNKSYHTIVLSNNITEPQDIGLDPTRG
jgi:low density lipoprotein-related protein 2